MSLVQLDQVTLSLGNHLVLDAVSLAVNKGELLALIGENGVGKTTLLKLLAQKIKPDSGKVISTKNSVIGFLPQEIVLENPMIAVRDFLEDNHLKELEKKMQECLEAQELDQWANWHEKFESLGGYKKLPVEEILHGLKLDVELLDIPFFNLSTGQKTRFALAKVLSQNPDILLLDEPTNHLDDEMIDWLVSNLKERTFAAVVVSHDRKFLNRVCNLLIEIKKGKLTTYGGSYDFYLSEQENVLEKELKAYVEQQEQLASLKQNIKEITFSKAKGKGPTDRDFMGYDKRGENHQKSLQRKLAELKKQVEEIEKHLLPHPKPKTIKGLRFIFEELTSHVAIELDHVTKSYGNHTLFKSFSRVIHRKDKIVIKGRNGAGKTTLLKVIGKKILVDHGQVHFAPHLKIGFLDQEGESLPADSTPLDYFEKRFNLNEESIRSELHKAGLGSIWDLNRPFSSLSVGQKKRLMLLSLTLEKPHVLLLDEPTNHLDFLTMEALEKALLEFKGAIVAVSHDATFIEKFGEMIWQL